MEESALLVLVDAAVGRPAEDPAWRRLWRQIEPQLWALVDRPRFASHLAHTEAARQRIVTQVHALLVADHCHQLQRYLDARRISSRLAFARWLRRIAKRIAMRYATREPVVERVLRRSIRHVR